MGEIEQADGLFFSGDDCLQYVRDRYTMLIVDYVREDGQKDRYHFVAFLVEHQDRLCLVGAGHIYEHIEQLLKAGRISRVVASNFRNGDGRPATIDFELRPGHCFYRNVDWTPRDFFVYFLSAEEEAKFKTVLELRGFREDQYVGFTQRCLEAGELNYQFAMVGCPAEGRGPETNGMVDAPLLCVSLGPPRVTEKGLIELDIAPGLPVNSLEGVSNSPVIAINLSNAFLFGASYAQDRDKDSGALNRIRCCPIEPLFESIRRTASDFGGIDNILGQL